MKIFGKQINIPALNFERIITWSVILALIISIFSISKCKKHDVTWEDCEEFAVSYADTAYLAELEEAMISYSKQIDNMPKGDTLVRVDTFYKNHTTFVKTWYAWKAAEDTNKRLLSKLEEAQEKNSQMTKELFEKQGGAFVETVPVEKELPIVETIKKDSSDNFDFEARILSSGNLIFYEHNIEVHPDIIRINVVGPTEYITKKNTLGIAAGVIYFDSRTMYFPATLRYGRKWWSIEAGPVFNDNFKIDGGEAKIGAEIKF